MSRKNLRDEKGQSLTELALAFTILLLLVGGILELGSILYTSVSLRDTVQEGALYASMHPTDPKDSFGNPTNYADLKQRVYSSASFPINANQIANITVKCDNSAWVDCVETDEYSCQGKPVTVSILYNYRPVSPLLGLPVIPLYVSVTNTILQSDARDLYIKLHNLTPCP